MSLRPLLPIRGVLEMLVASLCGDSCLETGDGGDVMWCPEFSGATVAGYRRTGIREPAVWSRTMLATFARRPCPVCEVAVDLGLGQSMMNPGQQPERTGSAGV